MKKTLLALSAFLFVACNTGSPYSAEPLSSADEVISSDMSSNFLPGASSECACSVEVESSSSAEISSSSSFFWIFGRIFLMKTTSWLMIGMVQYIGA